MDLMCFFAQNDSTNRGHVSTEEWHCGAVWGAALPPFYQFPVS
jgi:hypothetical protein